MLGGLDELLAFAEHRPVDLVVVALPWSAEARILDCLRRLRQVPADVLLCPDLVGLHLGHRGVTNVGGLPLLNVYDRPLTRRMRLLKAAEDYLLASLALLLTGPLMLLVALAIRLTSPGPVLFRQRRYGHGRVFDILKFRTMQAGAGEADPFVQARRDDPRTTPLGRILRRTSLDELPQLLNVLRGDMSLVGPRPHAVPHSEAMAARSRLAGPPPRQAGHHRLGPGERAPGRDRHARRRWSAGSSTTSTISRPGRSCSTSGSFCARCWLASATRTPIERRGPRRRSPAPAWRRRERWRSIRLGSRPACGSSRRA